MNQHCNAKVIIDPLAIASSCELSELFQHFAHQPWAMLLDSANSQHIDARFDIMVAAPIATITTHQQLSTVWQQDEPAYSSTANPLTLLEDLQAELFADCSASEELYPELPFLVGALGYFAYDLGRHFEALTELHKPEYDSPDMAVGLYSWSIIKDRHSGQFYYCRLENKADFAAQYFEKLALKTKTATTFSLSSSWRANVSEELYHKKLQQIDEYLRAGDCYQINFSQCFSAQYQGDEWQAYIALRQANQAPFSAFINLPNSRILSISPERFLSLKNGQVQSKPIKGTRPRFSDPQRDQQAIDELLNSEKDRAENLMIVDLLRNDLSKHCKAHTVQVPALFNIESFAAVHHLVSTVTGELDGHSSAYSLFQGAFPGGSITGAPKIRAMQIIDELEPHKRNIYCGSIGYFGIRKDMDSSICIRTLLCEKQNIYCWAGGGIVLDSVASEEYQESLDKVAKILPLLSQLA
ncbi:aminodeoxychorismate synthase component I [Paraglaciecola hydrolytica]|uniref:aminodeoxychorismate synthase n=1 Tax=Paraglaciecola hydrolytica TaxID=1799789 RepID=A0A148KN05_9ALTE|nr:aminodeoxychorismate synthase component I [Paraglaciecola hydrolytica]KXI27625.1 aminodeoxychorismate synthase component I [Paraglaciecola hydrolytica]